MERHALLTADGPVEIDGPFVLNGVQWAETALERWSPAERFARGFRPIVEPPTPFGFKKLGSKLEMDGAQVVDIGELEAVPFETLKAELYEAVRAKRWEVETAGIEVAGERVATDEKAQGKISGAVLLLDKDPARQVVNWEAQPGVWVALDRPTVEALGVAVGAHVQDCFDRCFALWEEIQAAQSHEDLQSIDIQGGWPATAG